jgi:uncharacterized protein YjeT (DUF2065 family)
MFGFKDVYGGVTLQKPLYYYEYPKDWPNAVVEWLVMHEEVLKLCGAVVIILGLWVVYEAVTEHNVEMKGEVLVQSVDSVIDEVEDLGADVVPGVPDPVWRVTPGNESKFIASVVLAAKVKFGVPRQDTAAIAASNRLVVRRFCSDLMTERGMRPTHISKFLDTVVEMVFIPSAGEILAKRLTRTYAWQSRRDAYRDLDRPRGRLMTRIRRALASLLTA